MIRLLLIFLTLMIGASHLSAHEIGTTRVRLDISTEGRWRALIATPPSALIARLAARMPDVERRADIDAYRPALEAAISLAVGGHPSQTRLLGVVRHEAEDKDRPAVIEILAEGLLPAEATDATWRFDLVATAYSLSIHRPGRTEPSLLWVDGDAASLPFSLTAAKEKGLAETVADYIRLGFTHVLPLGLDHILFILALCLYAPRLGPLLWQASAFTLAHSITLALTMRSVIRPPSSLVEIMIAVSIAYVAVENLAQPRATARRPLIVFAFGLLHGMGFAGALREAAPVSADLVPALIGFNLGVEFGQMAVIGLYILLVGFWTRSRRWYRAWVVSPLSLAIAAAGAAWTWERLQAAGYL
ncbi:HupE/UreJ family protein [Rhizobium sp. TRM95796]|uniref:HupE/UreJ family protein n=1 Tax=Rhizobium sp. TRM95796 TaxID=2979862 RepID=UPI0021E986DE|nr:HupE/UreJ family protein [Rhizobium sp. TRM95796]MCV3768608.1 HupE/UreJ family protein [Rhizobium sp. TRM95796]